ncbi:MAG TPA: dipeptide ABC transporter permease DppC, partial [Bdellovibrionales bacterium]|nr:dipeptide ABC transporter permease DppC [Bdellovibrionales bacterium]
MIKKLRENKAAFASLIFLSLWVFLALAAPFLPLNPPERVHEGQHMVPPMWGEGGTSQFVLGTDDLGRDLFSRLIFGARISLGFGFLCVFVAVLIGGTLGVTAGFFGGFWDRTVLRLVDVLMALPSLLLAIVVVA